MSEQNDETADSCEMLTATSDPVVLYQALCGATDEIEQLKRERDEVRQKYDILATEHMLEINRLCNERDEVRHKCAEWIRDFRGLRTLTRQLDEESNELLRERDEARATISGLQVALNAVAKMAGKHATASQRAEAFLKTIGK